MKDYRSMDFVIGEDGKLIKSTGTVRLSERMAIGVSICPKSGLPLMRPHTWPDLSVLIRPDLLERLSDQELYQLLEDAFKMALDPASGLLAGDEQA